MNYDRRKCFDLALFKFKNRATNIFEAVYLRTSGNGHFSGTFLTHQEGNERGESSHVLAEARKTRRSAFVQKS